VCHTHVSGRAIRTTFQITGLLKHDPTTYILYFETAEPADPTFEIYLEPEPHGCTKVTMCCTVSCTTRYVPAARTRTFVALFVWVPRQNDRTKLMHRRTNAPPDCDQNTPSNTRRTLCRFSHGLICSGPEVCVRGAEHAAAFHTDLFVLSQRWGPSVGTIGGDHRWGPSVCVALFTRFVR